MASLKPLRSLNLNENQQKEFIKYFKSLGQKPATTVRFFDRSDYYSVHANDAELAAKHIFKSTALLKIMRSGDEKEDLPYLCLSKNNFECFVRDLLLVKNYRVEVYVNKSQKNTNDWKLEYQGSPGNIVQFEDLIFNNDVISDATTIGINLKKDNNQIQVGIAGVDMIDFKFYVLELIDNDFFTELEAIIVLLGPKECILPAIDNDFARIKTLMERNSVMVSIGKKSDFDAEINALVQELNKLLRLKKGQKENAFVLPELNKKLACQSLSAVIKYLELGNDSSNLGQFEISTLSPRQFVHMDNAAVTALNIFSKRSRNNINSFKYESIFDVLNRCRTPQGHRLMIKWLKQPLRDAAAINDRHDIVECFLSNPSIRKDLYDDYLKQIPDMITLSKRLFRKKSLQDIYRIYQVIARMPKFLGLFKMIGSSVVDSIICEPLKSIIEDLSLFKEMVQQVLDFDGIDKGEYLIKPSFDNELQKLKDKLNDVEENIQKLVSKAEIELDIENIKLDHVSHLGYHFRITSRDDSIIHRNRNYKIIDAVHSGVRFTSKQLSNLNEDYQELRTSYEEMHQAIVNEIVKTSLGYTGPITYLNDLIAQIDCLVSFAVVAASAPIPYIRPKMHAEGTGIIKLEQIRHPCLELQDDIIFIANDVHFKKGESNMFIITGPNMGGKSTFIRSVGVTILMAQAGSFVPCTEAEISIVDAIMGRVGAGDCLIKGLSTFMVEMIETTGIIRTATENSLVIIDELGRGTSTYDGCGIAWSIAHHLATEIKCFALFATHFHEITELAQTNQNVKNCYMEAVADDENFTLMFKVRPGIMDKSFGIHVAKLADFPSSVVDMAQSVFMENEDHFSEIKTTDDKMLFNNLMEMINDYAKNDSNINDEFIKKMVADVGNKIIESKSSFFEQLLSQYSN